MSLLCITLIIAGFLQAVHGRKYFIYPIEIQETFEERSEVQSKEKHSKSQEDKVLRHIVDTTEMDDRGDEELSKNNDFIFNEKNAEQVKNKELNEKNAEKMEYNELNENNITNKMFLRLLDDRKVDKIMLFLKKHIRSTNYFFKEVKRIKNTGVVYDSLRKMALYLSHNAQFKEPFLKCFKDTKIVKKDIVHMWDQKPNNMIIDVMQQEYS